MKRSNFKKSKWLMQKKNASIRGAHGKKETSLFPRACFSLSCVRWWEFISAIFSLVQTTQGEYVFAVYYEHNIINQNFHLHRHWKCIITVRHTKLFICKLVRSLVSFLFIPSQQISLKANGKVFFPFQLRDWDNETGP